MRQPTPGTNPATQATPLLFLLTLLFLLPTAAATHEPPASFVTRSLNNNGYQPQFFNITYPLSSTDPDQVNGTFWYWLYVDGVPQQNITAHTAIPERAGWVYNVVFLTIADEQVHRWNIVVNNSTDGHLSPPSCPLPVDTFLGSGEGHSDNFANFNQVECGRRILSPPGFSAVVSRQITEDLNGTTDLLWRLSPSDPNQTVGSYDYRITRDPHGFADDYTQYLDPTDGDDGDGYRGNTTSYAGVTGQTVLTRYDIQARDPYTHQRAFACEINTTLLIEAYNSTFNHTFGLPTRLNVVDGQLFAYDYCGSIAPPTGGVADGTPSVPFPGISVPAWASSMGLTTGAGALLLAGILLLVLIVGGYLVADVIGAALGGIMGLPIIAVLSLIPLWFIILLFAAFAAVVVLRLPGRGGPA